MNNNSEVRIHNSEILSGTRDTKPNLIANMLIALSCIWVMVYYIQYVYQKEKGYEFISYKGLEINAIDAFLANIGKDIEHQTVQRPKLMILQDIYRNDDIVALLKIEGTNISCPVVQFTDNDYYLRHNIIGEYDKSGSIFMDYENNALAEDKNMIIYGHNMRDQTRFHNLNFYRDESFYWQNKYITLETAQELLVWKVFAVFITDLDFYYIQVHFNGHDEFGELLNQIESKSLYETHTSVGSNDRILTLSTCDYDETKRLVICAKLVGQF